MEAQTTEPVSALYWLPRIEAEGLPSPFTVTVPYDHHEALRILDGEPWPGYDDLMERMTEAVGLAGPKVFVRTDLSSAKHSGPRSYRVDMPNPEQNQELGQVVYETIEDNELKFWLTGPTPQAFLVRQWLDLDAPFTAFAGHPIAREWRLFATTEHVICSHFYWPNEAIVRPDNDDWIELLIAMAGTPYPSRLDDMATQAATACDAVDTWSVDFAQDRDGEWWLIDMAPAGLSWHPDH